MPEFSGYLEPEEIRKIIDSVPKISKHAERDQLLLEVMWQTGGRVSEVLELVPERIGTTSIVLHNFKQVKHTKGKDGKTEHTHDPDAIKEVETSQELCNKLKEYCTTYKIRKGDWVFPANRDTNRHLDRWYVWDLVGKCSEFCMIFKFGKRHPKTKGRFKGAFPHLFRHSNAMFLYEKTRDMSLVQQQLGHSNIQTTTIYSAAKKPAIKKAIKDIHF